MTRNVATMAARGRGLPLAAAACALMLCAGMAASAAPLTLWGADSLKGALGTVAGKFTKATGTSVTTRFGPSGTLRKDVEAGARPDLFASADTANPLKLQQEGFAGPVVDFASTRVVAVAAPGLHVDPGNLLATLLNPAVKLGTSTPVADPLGDYTEQIFAKANALMPGAKATLDAKAQRLIASPDSPHVPPGENLLVYLIERTHRADIFLAYESSATAARAIAPDLQEIELPQNLALSVEFGLTVLKGADPGTRALEQYILSAAGQAVLAEHGFGPPAPARAPDPASEAMTK